MSIADMPLMWLSGIFPALTHEMLAAGLTSALAMAGACYQFYRFMEEQGVRSMTRWLLLACFAVNPMIITYGGDGMSEALFILCLVASSRYLATWLRNRGARSLVTAGAWMGLAYMVRNEAVGAAGLATLLVGGATFLRERMLPTKMRRMAAATDMIVYVLPFVVAFAGWALVSWVIVGHPFEQYQSAYGTASQLKFLGLDHEGGSKVAHFEYVGQAMLLAAPLVLVLAAAVLARARRIGDPAVLGVIATLGGVCVFELAAYTTGQISWAFRYVIYVIPFAAMLAGSLSSSIDAEANGSAPWRLVAAGRRLNWSMSAMAAFVLLLPGLVTTGYTEMVSSVDPLDQQVLQWIVLPHDAASKRWEQFEHEWVSTDKMAQALDAMHLRSGELMVDTEEPCIPNLILESTNASQFFVPNDSDFKGKIGSPYTNGVRYLMVSSPQGYG
jgi:4-amino-4-deoxy-L-arabinose transferase-like glycosyltransferase